MSQRRFSFEEADRLQYYLLSLDGVEKATVYERSADADTIVFDKTGTLTMATPKVVDVVTFSGNDKDEMLRIAACLEEHYPHSIANAVVAEAARRGLEHDEMHSKVEYVVAHGIAISEGAQLARQISDVMISEDDLYKLITLKELSGLLMKRIHFNYCFVVGFNLGLIALGLLGTIAPASSAMLHNGSTIALGLHSMTNLKRNTEREGLK